MQVNFSFSVNEVSLNSGLNADVLDVLDFKFDEDTDETKGAFQLA